MPRDGTGVKSLAHRLRTDLWHVQKAFAHRMVSQSDIKAPTVLISNPWADLAPPELLALSNVSNNAVPFWVVPFCAVSRSLAIN